MPRILITFLMLLLLLPAAYAGKSAKQYSREIDDKTSDLKELQKSIKEKQLEKEKCLLEEKCIRAELTRIDKESARLQKKGEQIRSARQAAEKNLKTAEKALSAATWDKQQSQSELNRGAEEWLRSAHSHPRLYGDPVAEVQMLRLMRYEQTLVGNARQRENASQRAIGRWKTAQADLARIKAEHDANVAEQESLKAQKKEFLKSTIGRRILAEDEIKKLRESSQALEQLITRLSSEKKKKEEEAAEKKRFEGRKKYLPWPVQGDVTLTFGKSKHPELDTYLISNGIKIKAGAGKEVRAVDRGEVIFAGEFRSYGQMVIIDHSGSFCTLYGQLGDIVVREGKKVKEGEVIGKTGAGTQSILYFEVRSKNIPEDPLLWLK